MTLSLCMIVKNEAELLPRALENARIFADEIIIVDTGSTDSTIRVAQQYGRVFMFDWTHDFAAARNYAVSKVTCDYWMWIDADDIVSESAARAIARLKRTLSPETDIVMLPYVLDRDEHGKPLYVYYRERIVRNRADFAWKGRVHEAVNLHGVVVRGKPEIVHAKPTARTGGTRNLDIYKKMLERGDAFEPREVYYYARELYYNGEFDKAQAEFEKFLAMPNGFTANKQDACLMLSRCYQKLGDRNNALLSLFCGFSYGLPTGEACCEIALIYFAAADYTSAAYWFESATRIKPDATSGAFIDIGYYGFIPFVWLAVCYDRLGNKNKAYRYHCRAKKLRPTHPSVIANQAYFESIGY